MKFDHPAALHYFGVSGQALVWTILIIGSMIFCFTLLKRVKLIFLGKPDPRVNNIGKRLSFLIKNGIFQLRQLRYRPAGFLHMAIFWGFLVLGLHSAELIIGGLWPAHELPCLTGKPGAIYNGLKDIFVLAVLIACMVAIYQRAVKKPERYRKSPQFEAYLVLLLIIFLMITDMFYEASRLVSEHTGIVFLPAALLVKPLISGLNHESVIAVNHFSYWLHLIIFFFFLNLLPLSKHFHIITAMPNVFFRRLGRGELKPPRWDAKTMDELDEAGVDVFTDFTWKHILDFYTCTECGRCTDNCPVNAVGRPLSPKKLTMDIRDFGYANSSIFFPWNHDATSISGHVVPDEAFWSCTTCGACEAECPVFIEHIDKIIELRRRRVLMESRFPPEIEQIYRNIEIFGDAWGMGSALRMDWAMGLNIKTVKEDPDFDILFWVGCAGAFDTRAQQVAVAFSKVITAAGVKFGVLGAEEGCCGDYARRTGNEYLFQLLAQKNIRTLEKYGIQKIVTTCPHGFNTFKNEYPRFGGKFEVVHAADFILELLTQGKLNFPRESNKTISWHDPCYLGRHNGIYQTPRKILSLIPKTVLVEVDKSRDRSFCCGAGGGHFWMASSGQRINDNRVEQFLEKMPETIVTGCPYCLIMLEDGLESKEMKGKILVKDIVEIVAEAL
jgi:Fe-S oxidoreductase/nitrate reductase gamma subunit